MSIDHVTKDNFDSKVLNAEGTVLIDYWAQWCGPCRMIAPELEKLQEMMPGLEIVKVNIDEEPQLAQEADILSIPRLDLYRAGVKVGELIGAMPAKNMRERLEGFLQS